MIKRIELINFMSHRHTVIEPAAGLTVLIGPNNCGKSAFVTALQVLCHNSPSGFVLRHGEKKCEVIVETDDGHVIHWSRKKNGAGVYQIDGQPFDRLNGKVPAEVHQILKMPKVKCDKDLFDVHFGEQSDPVFLLRDKGKASAQFFASSSDATHLVAMQNLHKSKTTVAKRDKKSLSRHCIQIEGQLSALEPLPNLDSKLTQCEADHQQLESSAAKTEHLKNMIAAIRDCQRKTRQFDRQANSLAPLNEPPRLQDHQTLATLVRSLKVSQQRCRENDSLASSIEKLSPPPQLSAVAPLETLLVRLRHRSADVNFATSAAESFSNISLPPQLAQSKPLADLVAELRQRQQNADRSIALVDTITDLPSAPTISPTDDLQQLLREYKVKQKQFDARRDQIKRCDQQLTDSQAALENWVAENPVCPTCGGPTSAGHVLSGHRRGDDG